MAVPCKHETKLRTFHFLVGHRVGQPARWQVSLSFLLKGSAGTGALTYLNGSLQTGPSPTEGPQGDRRHTGPSVAEGGGSGGGFPISPGADISEHG